MDKRKESLLGTIIELYIKSAKPIGSKEIVEKGGFNISPATIRKELGILENEGYLFQPHVSAGRIPTNKGYRYYVDYLLRKKNLNQKEQAILKHEFINMERRVKRALDATAELLATFSSSMALAGDEEQFFGRGISNLLNEPEFSDTSEAKTVANIIDHPADFMEELLSRLTTRPSAETRPAPSRDHECPVEIFIGEEGPAGRKCSIIVSESKTPSGQKNYFALIGPSRMRYDRNISLMRYISKLLSSGLF